MPARNSDRDKIRTALSIETERSASDIAARTGLPVATVRAHLAQLRGAGFAQALQINGQLRWSRRPRFDASAWPAWAGLRAAA